MSEPQPSGANAEIEADRAITFSFDGQTVAAQAGQSIAAALYASGQRIFTRSFKYHRPRGLFCMAGDCPNCLMSVDGRPNVRTCVEPARSGQVVTHQNAWPSLGLDVLRIFDRLHRFLPVGFYYKRFHKPRWLWPIFENVVRHIAGLGRVDPLAAEAEPASIEHLHPDVCVIGGGPAGLAAAAAAGDCGAGVLLLERQTRLGGHVLWRDGSSDIEPLLKSIGAHPRVQVLTEASAFGLYEGGLIGAFQGSRLLKIRARQIIVCTGGRQRPFLFHNNDLPGIFLGDGVLRLARLHGVLAGRRAVVLTDDDEGQRLAQSIADLGMEVAAVVDLRPAASSGPSPHSAAWPVLASSTISEAFGNKRLTGARVAKLDGSGAIDERTTSQKIRCDILCMVSRLQPANELLYQGGQRFRFEDEGWRPVNEVEGLWAAGAAAGTLALAAQIDEGRRQGSAAAAALGYGAATDGLPPPGPSAGSSALGMRARNSKVNIATGKSFVCLCEDVTVKDIEQAVAEGFDNIETLKRYSTVNMGPCQGKMCGQAAIEVCARATGRDISSTGTTTSRPPIVPVELRVLAAGGHHPVRRTPLHHWHEAAGAQWLDAGLWKRPESYGDPLAEVRCVRQAAGLIDVSTLGKIELVGPDAADLLERVYLNWWADLKVGRARYGAMCTDEGVLFDDGVGVRLAQDHFYLTATTGNADAVLQWLERWRDVWGLDVTLLGQTSAVAAMNLAGPRARDILRGLTLLDVTNAGFPYLSCREGDVAGVPCRLLRIGFVGELGYEIHCPASAAWDLWEALIVAGKRWDLKPFGVEAQRILRLEKGHLIIGQDSDALSTPLDAGLEWMVRFDKPLFHGRDPLLRLKEMGARTRLVGFEMEESQRVTAEGSQVTEEGVPVGRVTSARFSPTLSRSLGLAWVPAARSAPGQRFAIRWNDIDVPARVAQLPFYDPKGVKLRE